MKQLTNCPICHSADVNFAFNAPTTRGLDQRQWSVCECGRCSHQFINPQPTREELEPYYHAEYEAYDPTHGANAPDEDEVRRARIAGKFRHIPVPTGMRVLDVGSGGGWFLRICKQLGATEQGVELSKHAAAMAQSQGLRVFQGSLDEYVAQASVLPQFDIITANHVVEHLQDPVATLRIMKGLLAPGGFIWISVPNAAYPLCRALKGRWHSSDLPYHLMQFSPASMSEAGHQAGLKVRRQTTESQPRFVAGSLRHYLRFRFLIPQRLTEGFTPMNTLAKWYAQRKDAKANGEAILTEFVAA